MYMSSHTIESKCSALISLMLIFCKAGGYKNTKPFIRSSLHLETGFVGKGFNFSLCIFPAVGRESLLQLEYAPNPQKLRRQDISE